jgi:hypothetical protein
MRGFGQSVIRETGQKENMRAKLGHRSGTRRIAQAEGGRWRDKVEYTHCELEGLDEPGGLLDGAADGEVVHRDLAAGSHGWHLF